MKSVFTSLPELREKVRASVGCLLMLDFDGTLSPLAKTPERAFLPQRNKKILQNISQCIPTIVMSGRSLANIKKKVGIKGITYVGNHGLEWEIDGKRGAMTVMTVPEGKRRAMDLVRGRLRSLVKNYPGALLEHKGLAVALHYRLLKTHLVGELLKQARQIITIFQKRQLLTIVLGKKVLEVRPAVRWNKGYSATFFHRTFGKELVPIYIGDDSTDEDVFKMLKKGIMIVVGKHTGSKADYFCRTPRQVGAFLTWLLGELRRTRNE